MTSRPGRFDVIRALIYDELGKRAPVEETGAQSLDFGGVQAEKPAANGAAREYREKTIEETLVAVAEKASDRLRSAIASSFPERLTAEIEHAAVEAELRRRMTEIQEMPGDDNSSSPVIARFEGRENPAVYKPVEREAGNQEVLESFCRYGIPPGTYAKREWLAFMIDRALGLDIVPTVVLRDGPCGLGSVQDWRQGDSAFDRQWIREAREDEYRREQMARMGLLDAAANNTDRISRNWLISPEGKHWAIDNSLILPTEVGRRRVEEVVTTKGRTKFDFDDSLIVTLLKNRDRIRSYPLWVVGNQPLPENLAESVRKFLGNAEVKGALKGAFDLALEDESVEAWQGFLGRLETILRDGLPENGWVEENHIASVYE